LQFQFFNLQESITESTIITIHTTSTHHDHHNNYCRCPCQFAATLSITSPVQRRPATSPISVAVAAAASPGHRGIILRCPHTAPTQRRSCSLHATVDPSSAPPLLSQTQAVPPCAVPSPSTSLRRRCLIPSSPSLHLSQASNAGVPPSPLLSLWNEERMKKTKRRMKRMKREKKNRKVRRGESTGRKKKQRRKKKKKEKKKRERK
jgi:hypothetical protein